MQIIKKHLFLSLFEKRTSGIIEVRGKKRLLEICFKHNMFLYGWKPWIDIGSYYVDWYLPLFQIPGKFYGLGLVFSYRKHNR